MNCTRCDGSGLLNLEQLDEELADTIGIVSDESDATVILGAIRALEERNLGPFCDISVCDCCGDGEDGWHGTPGQHYGPGDRPGPSGPYAYNGGLCACH